MDGPRLIFQDYCVIKGDEYALVQIREPERPALVVGEEGVMMEVEMDNYNVTLIITQDPARSLDPDSELLKLKFFVVLTRLRDFHPKRTLEKKFGDFRSGSASHHSHSGRGPVRRVCAAQCVCAAGVLIACTFRGSMCDVRLSECLPPESLR